MNRIAQVGAVIACVALLLMGCDAPAPVSGPAASTAELKERRQR
ncbi:MAG TPA: hypothetical protein VE666_13720 [Mycobacterium sp.]|nr:hypothetical protein [Mycobacterium sp.]